MTANDYHNSAVRRSPRLRAINERSKVIVNILMCNPKARLNEYFQRLIDENVRLNAEYQDLLADLG